jgi:hypothetical protein
LSTASPQPRADASLERDETEKLPIYAAAGVPQYVILNLRTDTAAVHTDPDPAARTRTAVARPGTLTLNAGLGGAVTVALADVLP